MTTREAFIIAGQRSPLGKLGGALRAVEAHELGAAVIGGLLSSESAGDTGIRQVIMANTCAFGNVARLATLGAGLPESVPAVTINAQCTGGLTAARMAADTVRATGAPVIAGGTESVSNAVVSLGGASPREHPGERPLVPHAPPPFEDPGMGPAAEAASQEHGLSREEQDDIALRSYCRTFAARSTGFFEPVICPLEAAGGVVDTDELPRRTPADDRLRRYPPAFAPGGVITPGNAAPIADGAAAVLIGDSSPPSCPAIRIVATAMAAADPACPPLAVVPAIEQALEGAGLARTDIDRWEINEAFAAKLVLASRRFGIDSDRLNVRGGAIAFGHPFAASGAMLLVHLAAELRTTGVRYGLAAIAGAGGLGEAMVLEQC